MNKLSIYGMALAGTIAVIAVSASAHHSPASYNVNKRVEVKGVVKTAFFRNPHGHVTLIVTDAKGKKAEWSLETSAANLLRRRGWTFSKVKAGVNATFIGHPNKTVPRDVYIREIRFADGTVFGDKGGSDQALD